MTKKMHHSTLRPRKGTPPLWEHVPAWVREQDDGTTQGLLEALQEQAAAWQNRIEQTRHLTNPTHTPPWALDPLLRTWGFDPTSTLTNEHKRRLIRWVVPLLQRAGTAVGIEQAVRAITGHTARCLPWNQGWTLDTNHCLDSDTTLAASLNRPQDAYAFDLVIQGRFNKEQQTTVRTVVEMLRPVHCPLRGLVQKRTPLQQEVRRLLTRCALCLVRRQKKHPHSQRTDGDKRISAALHMAAKVLHLPGFAKATADVTAPCRDLLASQYPAQHASSTNALGNKGTQSPSVELLDPTHADSAHASLMAQAEALARWSKAGKQDFAEALLWRLTRLPFHGTAIQDPATGQAADTLAIADLVLAVAAHHELEVA